jgi:hypothetical protein
MRVGEGETLEIPKVAKKSVSGKLLSVFLVLMHN